MNNTFKELVSDNKLLFLFILIVCLGIFVRLYKFSDVGYWSDDETTLPTGLLWFYNHDYYPGLLGQGEPALGNYIFGKACMLSGEDFSGVTQFQPRFYPGREVLIGPQLVRANNYCHAPMYIFSLLFFFVVIVLALLLLRKHGVILVTSLLAFNPLILVLSRWIHVDIILYTFVVFGLISLFKSLKSVKGSRAEMVWWVISITMMSLAFGTKLPASVYIVFVGVVMSAKYLLEIKIILGGLSNVLGLGFFKDAGESKHTKDYWILVLLALFVCGIVLYFAFDGNFSNIPTVIKAYQSQGAELSTLMLNKGAFTHLFRFLSTFSNLDMLVLIAAIFYFPFLLKRLFKGLIEEKFVAGLIILLVIMLAFLPTMTLERVFFLFSFGLLFASGMLVDNVAHKLSSAVYVLLILLMISLPFAMAVYTSPDFIINDKFYNILKNPISSGTPISYGARWIGEYLNSTLGKNETYFPADTMTMVTYYVRYDQQLQYYLTRENFKAQYGRSPYVEEFVQNFKPNNQRIRYLLIDKNTPNQEPYVQDILNNYEPNHIVYQPSIREVETIRVYDLDNLKKK